MKFQAYFRSDRGGDLSTDAVETTVKEIVASADDLTLTDITSHATDRGDHTEVKSKFTVETDLDATAARKALLQAGLFEYDAYDGESLTRTVR